MDNANLWFVPLLLQFRSKEDASNWANGTSGDDGVVSCTDSGGGVNGAVDGSVVKVENTGGETNWVS